MNSKALWFLALWGISLGLMYYAGAPPSTLVGVVAGIAWGWLMFAGSKDRTKKPPRTMAGTIRRTILGLLYAMVIYVLVVSLFDRWKEPQSIFTAGVSEVVLHALWIAMPVAIGFSFVASVNETRGHASGNDG